MRLCQVVEAAAGGTGRHVIELTRGLAERGHELTLIYSPLRIDALFAEGLSALAASLVPLAMARGVGWNDVGAARGLGGWSASAGRSRWSTGIVRRREW